MTNHSPAQGPLPPPGEIVSTSGADRGVRRLVLGAAAAVMSLTSAVSVPAAPLRTAVTVRVYQSASLAFVLEPRALAEAERILAAAFVDVRWRICRSPSPEAGCEVSPGASELLLRVVPGGPDRQDSSARLGEAYVVCGAGGVLATVFFNWVARLADSAQADIGTLLGRVIAHELGHLIMRPSVHTRRGLMRPSWTYDEVRRNRAGDWAFTAGDVAAMRRRSPGSPRS
jgi:hypothetical protein